MGLFSKSDNKTISLKSISEVSKELEIEPHILRFWESKIPDLAPSKGKGMRRLYSLQDIEKLKKVKDLLYNQGYKIEGVARLLKQEKKVSYAADGKEYGMELSKEILRKELQQIKRKLNSIINQI